MRGSTLAVVLFVAVTVAGPRAAPADEAIWIEGEQPTSTTFNHHPWYSAVNVEKDLLSPGAPGGAMGDWLAHFSPDGTGATATWTFTVADAGPHAFWIRCNPFETAQQYALDGAPLATLDTSDARETINVLSTGVDIRFMAWIKVGMVTLAAGSHTLTVQVGVGSGGSAHAGIDAILFIDTPWAPSGPIPPPAMTAPKPAKDAWFLFHPDDDAFSPASITDMSQLLPGPAGNKGFLHQMSDQFVFDDGSPVKLWGIDAAMAGSPAKRDQQARFYAKNGINVIRQQPVEALLGVLIKDPATGARSLDPVALDAWDHWFATLKSHGLYMTWSSFSPHVITPDDGYPADLYAELPVLAPGKSSAGLVNFMPVLQQAEWQWLQTLLEHTNPYTGLRYVDDPALAIVETHNEDCLFASFPLDALAAGSMFPRHTVVLQEMWQKWLLARYGTDAKLAAAWGSGLRAGDSLENPDMGMYGAWEMTAGGPAQNGNEKARMGDFIHFLADTQRGYYANREMQLRGLGFKGITVTTAWMAGPAADAANLYADGAATAIDRHAYFGGGVGGDAITTGMVDSGTHLAQPGSGILASGMYQTEDKPYLMTAWTQSPPNQWKAEIAPLLAFYGMGLQGWDASHQFAGSLPRMGGGWPGESAWATETPAYLGQFPALAFAVHKGHVMEAPVTAARRPTFEDIYSGVDVFVADPAMPTVEALAYGRVTTQIGDGLMPSAVAGWDKGWDRTNQVITSATNELVWDYKNRVVTLHGMKTEAVIGFAGGMQYDLPGASVSVTTQFVSLILTPLDDQPLVSSLHVLVTALARDKQMGATYSDDGTQLLTRGGPPLLLEPVQATITFKGGPIDHARAVDVYGVPTGVEVERSGNTIQIDGRYATYYYEITRPGFQASDGGIAFDDGGDPLGGGGDGGGRVALAVIGGCGCNLAAAPSQPDRKTPADASWMIALGALGLVMLRRCRPSDSARRSGSPPCCSSPRRSSSPSS